MLPEKVRFSLRKTLRSILPLNNRSEGMLSIWAGIYRKTSPMGSPLDLCSTRNLAVGSIQGLVAALETKPLLGKMPLPARDTNRTEQEVRARWVRRNQILIWECGSLSTSNSTCWNQTPTWWTSSVTDIRMLSSLKETIAEVQPRTTAVE